MKKIIGIALSSLMLTGTALANAGPAPCPVCVDAPVAKWAGLKFGAGVGFSAPSARYAFTGTAGGPSVERSDIGRASFAGGPTIGYFANMNPDWLLGAEVGVSFSNMNPRLNTYDPTSGNVDVNLRATSHATMYFVPQIAYLRGDSKFHLGVGWAGAKWKTHDYFNGRQIFKTDDFRSALRLALGATQKFNKYSLGLEATYDWFGSSSKRDVIPAIGVDANSSFKPRVLSFLIKWSYDMDGMF
jgi:hypothetical protein